MAHMEKEPGFVYILTNPSFKEDWVKIGKSSRPVDVRSKELDNTAVPLPFEIYATLQTSKYNAVEKLVHKTIDRLTDLRIRQNREFFNVRPDVALDILRDIASTLDDAAINSYNHGDVIHIAKGDAEADHDKTSMVKKLKNDFWRGYVEAMKKDAAFNSVFSLHRSIPRYSYDLAVGTSACNIYQVATRKKLTVGLYFHGKELFLSLSGFRKEIDRIIGCETDWTEYDKDSSIDISREFSLEDASQYEAAYAWFAKYSLLFKQALDLSLEWLRQVEATPVKDTEMETEEEGDEVVGRRTRQRPPFRFSMVGIPVGEELEFVPTGIRVRVASDNQIEYEGRIYKLSPFVGTFMPVEKRNTSGAYQGAKFFTYKGEVLDSMRLRMESCGSDEKEGAEAPGRAVGKHQFKN